MSIDNIVQISVDTFDPKDKPKTVYINLNTATLEELKPYIGIDDRVRDA
jgi:DNA uptake protein ComE-like DNA-binding protein